MRTMPSTIVAQSGLSPSAKSLASKTGKKSGKDATKATARDLPVLVTGFRDDKSTPNKAVSAFNRSSAGVLTNSGLDSAAKLEAIDLLARKAKSDALAAIDRQVMRANKLAGMPRGTTGKGNIHWADVCVEIFGGATRKTAVENNSRALGL